MNPYRDDMLPDVSSISACADTIDQEAIQLRDSIERRDLIKTIASLARIARLTTVIDIHTVRLMEEVSLDYSAVDSTARKHVEMWAVRIRTAVNVNEATQLLQSFAIQTMEAAMNRTIDNLCNIVGVTKPDEV